MPSNLKHGLPGLAVLLSGTILILSSTASATSPVSEEAHHSFEKKFAEMCIEKEKAELKGSGVLLSEVTSVCECIAREESKRVTSEEVREFVIEGKYPASLMMKSNAATYICLQEKK